MNSIRGWPWPFLLLLAGAVVATVHGSALVTVSSSVVLIVFLPPLLFDAGFSLGLAHLRQQWRWIALFGVAGSVIAAAFTCCILYLLRFPSAEALLLSAVLAATDPVSVFTALRGSSAPARLRITLEGESLANDAVAVVLITLALGIVTSSNDLAVEVPLLLLRLSLVGLAVGLAVGFVLRWVLSKLRWPLSIAASLPLAYAAFFAADRLGGSGLLAAIVSAVVAGGAAPGLEDPALHRFWRALGGLMAALVFLLIGLQVRIDLVARVGWRLLLLLLAVTLSRLLMVLIITRAAHRLWPWRWQAALTWAGLRGTLSLALALSIPGRVNDRVEVVTLTAGFILVSSAIQALWLRPVFRRLGLAATPTMGSS
jgi:CPA1 family monovalent cation:H+ antiporter